MTCGRKAPILLLLVVGLTACAREADREPAMEQAAAAAEEMASKLRQVYPNLPADVMFANDRVVAQRIVGEPDVWAGEHSHTGSQLVVVVKGGTLTYREGGQDRPVTYEAGDVFWVQPTQAHDHATTSQSPFEGILISIAPGAAMSGAKQAYPNVTADVVFENEAVIAQKLASQPNVWAGEHSHAGGQLVVVLKDGTVTYREGDQERLVMHKAGDVFPVDATPAHDHALTAGTELESILITMK